MKAGSSPKEIGGSSMMRGYSGSRAAMSPDGDTVLLDDSVFHTGSHNDTSLHSIPEVGGHHSASIWNESAFHDEHGSDLLLSPPPPPPPLLLSVLLHTSSSFRDAFPKP